MKNLHSIANNEFQFHINNRLFVVSLLFINYPNLKSFKLLYGLKKNTIPEIQRFVN